MLVAWPVCEARAVVLHRPEASGGVVVGDHEQAGRDGDPDQRAEPEVESAGGVAAAGEQCRRVLLEGQVVHQPERDRQERSRGEHAGHDQPLVERALHVARGAAHREGPDDRGDERDAADHQRVDRHLADLLEGEHAEQHHRDRGHRVGLEQVGRHARAVADVVAHVVGDHRGVARVVLGDPGLDLADDVGPDVGGLGEDAAAQTCEHGDQRAAEPEADERVDGVLLVHVGEQEDRRSSRPRPAARGRPRAGL